jgi:hypothetical protein
MTPLKQKLKEINACYEAMEWVGDRTIEEAVNDCHRGDWLLWLGQRIEIDHRKLTLAKGHCANTVRHLMKDKRSIEGVDAAIAYGEGKIDKEELAAAADAASDASDAACNAACYAASAADAAAYYDAASGAAFDAAAAADDAANFDDDDAAKQANQKQTADICRQYIGQLIIDKFNEL